jgi:hypothetical protein
MNKHGGHEDLHDSGRWSVIPYVHGRIGVVLQCVVQVLAWLFRVGVERTSSNWRLSGPFTA